MNPNIIMEETGGKSVARVLHYRADSDTESLIGAQKEIRHRISVGCPAPAGLLTVKAEQRSGYEGLERPDIQVFNAELECVAVSDHADVILDLIGRGDELFLASGSEAKAATKVEAGSAHSCIQRHVPDT